MSAPRSACFVALLLAGCGPGRAGAGDVDSLSAALGTCAAGPVVQGIDVSHYDGTIDWAKVKASGIDFAFMKATEGTTFVDPDLATNWKGAGAAGVIRGAYHFFHANVDAVAQADFFIATAGVPARGDLPLALDLEVTDNVAGATVAADARTFLARVQEKTGRVPVVYTSDRVWTQLLGSPASTGFSDVALWDAMWTTSCPTIPPAWTTWTFWQNSSTGTVPGISATGAVDLDQFNGSLGALQAYVSPPVDGGSDGGSDGGGDGGTVDGGTDDGGPLGHDDDAGVTPTPRHGGCSLADGGAAEGGATGGASILCLIALAAIRKRAKTAA